MLQFMGRENMSDYNSDFLTMLETWDAAVNYLTTKDGKSIQPIVIAELLGWTQLRRPDNIQMDRTRAKWISLEWQGADGSAASEGGTEVDVEWGGH
jgi:hypothetical protein